MERAQGIGVVQAAGWRRNWRMFKDRAFGLATAVGGISVIVAIVLIFFYLLYVVAPLFSPPRMTPVDSYQIPLGGVSPAAHIALGDHAEVGLVVTGEAGYLFFEALGGRLIGQGRLIETTAARPVKISAGDPTAQTIAVALSDGTGLLARPVYELSYPNDKRVIIPSMIYPLGRDPVRISAKDSTIELISAQSNTDQSTIATWTRSGDLTLTRFTVEESLLGDESAIDTAQVTITVADPDITQMIMDVDQRELYVASRSGYVSYYDIRDQREPRLVERKKVVAAGASITTMAFLSGGISVLIGDSSGTISQWFPVRDDENTYSLVRVRAFDAFDGPVARLAPEYSRKGFVAADASGNIGLFHTTANRTLLKTRVTYRGISQLAIAPRADTLAVLGADDTLHLFAVHNAHPEVSWRSLWGRVWYESRAQPEWIWQSSSATNDFEPKFSLTPLAFGTLKAAFYAMLFAIPLAILGAVYTAYFMTSRMRSFVKPSIEIMAALPTVIVGFLAGLWLAPVVESVLAGVFLSFALIPMAIVAACYLFERLPGTIRHKIPGGWEAALLVPVVCLAIWLAVSLSHPIETAFFGGDLPHWLSAELGISYDQRNSLVVGMAIGFSVIPIIFSISEDAVFGVPRHLSIGSLALGATPWQTVIRVVLLTASPGIFSAVMIGVGRAVGETMIVLMATGNTPIIDFNIFQGFRALSANIAIEMPETEVGSTHYRVLFLAALVLFIVTFFFNTVAEIVRQRLRLKYSNL